jgi:hypothetical protein
MKCIDCGEQFVPLRSEYTKCPVCYITSFTGKNLTLNDLAVKHDYYCESTLDGRFWEDWEEFYDEFHDADIDMNLVCRWDIFKKRDGNYFMKIFMIYQRKGYIRAHYIDLVVGTDVPSIIGFLERHYAKLQQIWKPIGI